ncbi:hypothetical protein CEXT_316851 [Caerostris extrusa]|uniref:C2H2-type domain-containing protein n=1 Tax=Caerostris extrusa TaxID=172846 RepID=A0AAV4WU29_CAEEX|nr:hypothetical protein CEXT_316851 [Caerostris extrusa]
MSVATPCVLPGFQRTFDRRNFISYATHPSESSVNCEKYSKDQSLGGAAYTSQNMDAPQERKNPPYESSKCPMQFKQKVCLESHESCHNVKKTHVCRFCDKSFTLSDTLGISLPIWGKSYVCSFCDKAILGEKPHSKPHSCKKCCSDGANLNKNVHISHTDEKPYECNKCGKNYAYTSSLRRHMLKHAGEERSKCDSCGDEFSSEESLAAHKCKEE